MPFTHDPYKHQGLFSEFHLRFQHEAINDLSHLGLKKDDFNSYPDKCAWFDSEKHVNALKHLMQNKNLGANQAIPSLKNLSQYQLSCIFKLSLLPHEIQTFNEYQCEVLLKLDDKNLKPNDIEEATWLNSRNQINCLASLLDKGKTIQNALDIIKGLNDDQLMGIEMGFSREGIEKISQHHINTYRLFRKIMNYDITDIVITAIQNLTDAGAEKMSQLTVEEANQINQGSSIEDILLSIKTTRIQLN